jgi:threonine aldolase
MAAVVDLRSDTVTRPSGPMRTKMATAEVGDDVYGEDPTVRALEERVADLLGTESSLFVPSGTMANQIALRAHTKPADEIIISKDAHCWRHESGGLAANAGLQTLMLGSHIFTGADVRAAFKGDDPYQAHTRVVTVENTHNMGGGIVWEPAQLAEVVHTAKALGIAAHLDGARLWNAAVATKTTEKELAAGFDSIMVALSKGLGAPIGSMVAGSRDFIRKCHRFRKMQGGGMRQAGIIAAAGLYALEHNRARLVDDHANARALAEALVGVKNLELDLARVQTNIVMIDVTHGTADAVVQLAKEDGVLLGTAGAHRVRAVTHLDVDRDGVMRAANVIADIAAAL